MAYFNSINLFALRFCILFLCYTSYAFGQNQSDIWNIKVLGMNVGTLKVDQKTEESKLIIDAVSDVEVRILFKFKVKYTQKTIYENGKLLESSLKTYKKGKLNSSTHLKKTKGGYELNRDGKLSFIVDNIDHSGSMLYFHEPINKDYIYIELYGEKTTVVNTESHKYSIVDPDTGKKNSYLYEKGVLEQAVLKHTLANVYLNRRSIELKKNDAVE